MLVKDFHLTLFKTLDFSPTVSTLRDIVHRRVPIISILLPVTLRSERTENSLCDDYFNIIPSDHPHEFLARTFRSLIYPRPKTLDFSEVSDLNFRSTLSVKGGSGSNDPIVNGLFNRNFNVYHQEVLLASNMRRISTSMYVMGHIFALLSTKCTNRQKVKPTYLQNQNVLRTFQASRVHCICYTSACNTLKCFFQTN